MKDEATTTPVTDVKKKASVWEGSIFNNVLGKLLLWLCFGVALFAKDAPESTTWMSQHVIGPLTAITFLRYFWYQVFEIKTMATLVSDAIIYAGAIGFGIWLILARPTDPFEGTLIAATNAAFCVILVRTLLVIPQIRAYNREKKED